MERTKIAEIVIERLSKASKNKEITLDSNLKELGLDSLDVVDLLMEMEEQFEIEFEIDENGKVVNYNVSYNKC